LETTIGRMVTVAVAAVSTNTASEGAASRN